MRTHNTGLEIEIRLTRKHSHLASGTNTFLVNLVKHTYQSKCVESREQKFNFAVDGILCEGTNHWHMVCIAEAQGSA